MRKTIVVAVREYQAAVKTKAFIISIVAMPVFMGGAIAFQKMMEDRIDTTDRKLAVVDQTGVLFDDIAAAATQRNESAFNGQGPQRRKIRPRFLVERVQPATPDRAQLEYELPERVRRGDLFAFVIIPAEIVKPGQTATRVAYHSNAPTYEALPDWLSATLNDLVRQRRLTTLNLDPQLVQSAIQRIPLASMGLVDRDTTGQIIAAQESNRVANMLLPIGLLMLMWMVVMVSASPLMQSVLEEKMQRISEVLLGCVTPFELMMGKLLGVVGVSLTMATIYLAGAFYAIHQTGFGAFFPTHLVWWFVVFQALAVLLFGSVFIAIGAAVTDMKEAQSLMTPAMIVVMLPLFVWMHVVENPQATSSLVLSLIPPATPMLMIVRQAVPPGVPLWQPLLGVALVLLTTLAGVFAAGRIFRVGILMQGKGANVGAMLRWVIRG